MHWLSTWQFLALGTLESLVSYLEDNTNDTKVVDCIFTEKHQNTFLE